MTSRMTSRLWTSAFGLLLVTGTLLGATPPLGKLATEAGASAALWSFVISFGAGSLLLVARLAGGHSIRLSAPFLRYYAVAAIISYAIPNLLMFSAVPHLGAGYTGIMFTLSPVITLVFSVLLRVRRPGRLGITGIGVGFFGAVLVAMTRGTSDAPADLHWVLLALFIPVSLAAGNIYRTIAWPEDARPTELAAGSHLAAAFMLAVMLLLTGTAGTIGILASIPLITFAQAASSAAMFAFFFRLQIVGGPVYLSQIGYVAAAIGLFVGIVFLGERYGPLTWLGALVIAAGVAMTTRAEAGQS